MIPCVTRRTKLRIAGAATLVLGAVLLVVDETLKDAGAGIIAFELAGSEDRADEIVDGWRPEAMDAARLSLWLDFAFMAAYGTFLSLAARALHGRASGRVERFGRLAAGSAITAAGADVLENVLLLLTLGGHGGGFAPAAATVFALVKFVELAYVLGFILLGLVVSRR